MHSGNAGGFRSEVNFCAVCPIYFLDILTDWSNNNGRRYTMLTIKDSSQGEPGEPATADNEMYRYFQHHSTITYNESSCQQHQEKLFIEKDGYLTLPFIVFRKV
jgi:hypothetical protein